MQNKKKQLGISLTEILVVIAVMAILMSVSIPATRALMASFESGTGARQLINAALSSARAVAIREQTYAGVRFQQAKDGSGEYIILIEHDPALAPNGFHAVEGRKPMKLPEEVKVSTASVVFSPAGKLTVHNVQCLPVSVNDNVFNSSLGSALFNESSGVSANSIELEDVDGNKTTEYISPYTGELVMEYREQTP